MNKKVKNTSKLKIRKGDKVLVITGASKGVEGEVKEVLRDASKLIIGGVNLVKKHLKPTESNPTGGIVEVEAPIHISNVMLVDPKSGEATRVGRKLVDQKLVRYSVKTGETI